MSYGSIGFTVGHEVSHAFDVHGMSNNKLLLVRATARMKWDKFSKSK